MVRTAPSAAPATVATATAPVFGPGPTAATVRAPDGEVRAVPEGWTLLPPGDAALTRRVKAAGPHWVVAEVRRRRSFALGVYAPASTIDRIQSELAAERATEGHAQRQASSARRRERVQTAYVLEFQAAVVAFLRFAPEHAALADQLARAVTAHATPVGSGTVARTERIPVAQRAEAAVIAWMRHQTTAYDHLSIARIKGERRAVRRDLARGSQALLDQYRRGGPTRPDCPLQQALASPGPGAGSTHPLSCETDA